MTAETNVSTSTDDEAEASAWSSKEALSGALQEMGPNRRCYVLRLIRALYPDDWDQVTNEEFVPRSELGVALHMNAEREPRSADGRNFAQEPRRP